MSRGGVELDVSGMDRLLAAEPGIVGAWLDGVAEQIVSEIKLSFGTSPAGRAYQVGPNTMHIASQPGYPPNVDTGNLRASMRWERDGAYRRVIMDGTEYGYQLEFGSSRVAPRPFVRPVFQVWRRRIGADARQHLGLDGGWQMDVQMPRSDI
jgi:hypothetical protein